MKINLHIDSYKIKIKNAVGTKDFTVGKQIFTIFIQLTFKQTIKKNPYQVQNLVFQETGKFP